MIISGNKKRFIEKFNKNKTKENYREILNEYFPNNKKCRCCNDVIYYYDSTFSFSKDGNELKLLKKSYMSTKNVNDVDYYLSVCEDCLTKKYPEYETKNKTRVFNRVGEITIFAYNIPEEEASKWKKYNYAVTLNNLISKYGEKIGKEKWKHYCDKQSETNTFEYKKNKYGWDEKQFKEYNISRSVTKKNLIKKHGEIKGMEIWNSYIEKQSYSCKAVYFIEKYGEEEGLNKFDVFNKSRLMNYSPISEKLFDIINQKLEYKYTLKYAEFEKLFVDEKLNKFYYLDCYIVELNVGIEFNGDVYHANPEIYTENDKPNPFRDLTSKELWDLEETRNNFLKTKLNDLIIVWEKDVRNYGIEHIADKIVNYIKEYEQSWKKN